MSTSTLSRSPEADAPRKRPQIAIAGNPNTGKSTVFNALCGTRQKVANYPGVTVEKKMGFVFLGDREAELVDLPGLYSLTPVSPDEEAAADVLMGRLGDAEHVRPDLILCVLDATNLKRNLFLFSQVLELDLPVVVALTMTDLMERAGVQVNVDALQKQLGVPVVPVVTRERQDLVKLTAVMRSVLDGAVDGDGAGVPQAKAAGPGFPKELESLVSQLQERLASTLPLGGFEARQLLVSDSHALVPRINEDAGARQVLLELREKTRDLSQNPAAVAIARYRWIDELLEKVERREPGRRVGFSAKLDSVLTHRLFGFAAFAGIMYTVFQAIYSWAGPFMDFIDEGTGMLGDFVGGFLVATPMLQSLIVDGVITGVGSVVIFLPQIVILFLFIAFLEDSGYLARAAFLMDRLLGWTGLNGRAFIPMLSSFACAVPGVMAARVMPDPRARLTTILIAPLMSCSARLPVYLLMIGAFIEPHFGAGWAAFTLFAMHGLGLVVALPVAWFLNRGFLKTPSIPFVLELPEYRWPIPSNVAFRAYEASKKFLLRAGTVIFAASIIIWAMSYFPRPDSVATEIQAEYAGQLAAATEADEADEAGGSPGVESDGLEAETAETAQTGAAAEELQARIDNEIAGAYLEQSFLGRLGHAVQPVFAPLGFDWKISVGILGAFPAREVIIATLGIIYNVGADVDEESDSLRDRMAAETHSDGAPVYTPLVAITLMIFFALCSQCMSTLATVWRELNSWQWAAFMFVYMTSLAYVFGLVVYQAGRAFGLE
ncbi:MAG: ferrous iron transport protein B [bacterium]|nr:ferrous iron transport protein B [bacterium]